MREERGISDERSLLSPGAIRLFKLIEPIPSAGLSLEQIDHPYMEELVRYGLVEIGWTNSRKRTVSLSRLGRELSYHTNN